MSPANSSPSPKKGPTKEEGSFPALNQGMYNVRMKTLSLRVSSSLFVPIYRDGGCQFFQWADEVQQQQPSAAGGGGGGGATPRSHFSGPPPPSSSSARSHGAAGGPSTGAANAAHGGNSSSGNGNGSGNGAEGVCRCGDPASVVVTKKAGPNLGRQFYACRKPRYAPVPVLH